MQVTPNLLKSLENGFNTALIDGLNSYLPNTYWAKIAMETQSKHAEENYGWLEMFPGLREFVGQRVINNLSSVPYTVKNKTFENTIAVKRTAIEDDAINLYGNVFRMQGEAAAMHPDEMMFNKILGGFDATGGLAYDGQYFFDADHVGYAANKSEISYSNVQTGSSPPWLLLDLRRNFMRPFIMQNRSTVEFTAQNKPEDDNVFMRDEYLYGVRVRYNAGYGFHQLALGSKAELTADSYRAARTAMMTQRRPDGNPLPVIPSLLVYGPTNEYAVKKLINSDKLDSGASNPWFQSVPTLMVEWLQ